MLAMSDSTAGTTAFSEWNAKPLKAEDAYTCDRCGATKCLDQIPKNYRSPRHDWRALYWFIDGVPYVGKGDNYDLLCPDCCNRLLGKPQ